MKSFPQLSTLGGRVPILLIELTVFSGVLGFRRRGHGRWSIQHGVIPYLHEDASRICGKPWINNLETRPSVSGAVIPVPFSGVLSIGVLPLLRVWELSAQISVARMKSVAFLTQGWSPSARPRKT